MGPLPRLALALALLATPSPVRAETAKDVAGVAIATGSPIGVYFAVGNAICRLLQREKVASGAEAGQPRTLCAAQATGGSLPNVDALRGNAVDAAIIQSDTLYAASRGTGRFEGRKTEKLRALFSLHAEPYQLLVAKQLGIRSILDLKGRKVNLGPKGSTQHEMTMELFRLHKLDERSFAELLTLPMADQFLAFCRGDVEALGVPIGYPATAYTSAIGRCHGEIISVDTPQARRLVESSPYFASVTIPKGTYPALQTDIQTFGVLAVLSVSSDLADVKAYAMARAVFEHLGDLKAMHPALAGLEPARMLKDGLTVPFHPGAMKYYRERGWAK